MTLTVNAVAHITMGTPNQNERLRDFVHAAIVSPQATLDSISWTLTTTLFLLDLPLTNSIRRSKGF